MSEGHPIGMFDSGLGGLSVLRDLIRLLPGEDVIYVADSAHVPYGPKPPEFIRARSRAIARFLVEQHQVKALVVACNTATTHAVDTLRQELPSLPIVGMEPAVKPAAAATRSGIVGVLATEATLGGERFVDLAQRYSDGIELLTQPSPGLVECVEAGQVEGGTVEALLREFTGPMLARGADTIVLGCTHYPFLRHTLQQIVGPAVTLIDTGEAVARQTARVLGSVVSGFSRTSDGPPEGGHHGELIFYSSGDVDRARSAIEALLGRPVDRVRPLPV